MNQISVYDLTVYGRAKKYRVTSKLLRGLWVALWVAIPIPVISGAFGIATSKVLFKKDYLYIRRGD